MQWHEPRVSVSASVSVWPGALSRRAARSAARARRPRRGIHDRKLTRSRDATGRDAKSFSEDPAKVARATEAALLRYVLHSIFACLDKTYGHDQAQAIKVLARRDSPSLPEESGKVEPAQLGHFCHLRDPDRSSVVLPTVVLDSIDERRLDKPSGSPGSSHCGQAIFRQLYENYAAEPGTIVGRHRFVFQRHLITS